MKKRLHSLLFDPGLIQRVVKRRELLLWATRRPLDWIHLHVPLHRLGRFRLHVQWPSGILIFKPIVSLVAVYLPPVGRIVGFDDTRRLFMN